MDDRGYVIPAVGLRKAAEEERNKKIPLRATRPTPFLSSLDETLSGWGPNENVSARVVEPEVAPTVVEPDENPITRAVRVVRSIPSRAVDTAADLARKLISSDEYQSTGDRLVQDNRVNFGDPNVAADFFRASDALKRMGYSEGGMPEGVPEWATPRTPEDASAAINRERERLAKEQELARMNTPEFQQQTADRMFQESFSPERLARMTPGYVEPTYRDAAINDALSYARQLERQQRRQDVAGALAQTWPARAVKDIYGTVTLPGDVALGRTDPRSDEVIKRALDLAFLPVGNAPAGAIGAGIRLRPTEGVKQVQRGTPEHAVANARPELSRLVSPFSDDPESVRRALEIAATYRVPQGTEFGTNSFFRNKPSMSVKDIQPDIGSLPGVTPAAPRPINWEQFGKEAKGGTMINVGGDRLNLGLLRDINNEGRLAWEVPLHAGPKYMLEPNPGLVWANAPTHTTSFNKIIAEAAKKGPVYGVYAPMGPTAVDSSVGMFNAVMSQIPTAKISRAAAKEFDDMVRSGIFTNKIKDRPSTAKTMGQIWPGISKIKDQETALKLAGEMTGTQRGDLVKAMEAAAWRNKNFPEIGVTRVAVTDPALLSTPTNTIGHRIVKFDTEGLVKPNRKFMHQTYPTETRGQYFADVPVVQTQYGMPIPMQQRLLMPDKSGNISHPYSLDTMGRSNARKLFTEQKQTQPIDDRMIESILLGLKRQKEYGFRRGGSIPNHAVVVAKRVHGDQWK